MDAVFVLEHVAELCATSTTPSELARKIVHSQIVGTGALGMAFYTVTQRGELELIGHFGRVPNLEDDFSIWSKNPIALAVATAMPQSQPMQCVDGSPFQVNAFPITRGNEPIGVGAVVKAEGDDFLVDEFSKSAVRTIANTCSIWYDTLGFKIDSGSMAAKPSGRLTHRQQEVLQRMANGKTNAQIAVDLILSESSIRQETVKIYRALGVATRLEAAQKGLNLGLVGRRSA